MILMANITFTENSGLQDSVFGKSQAPIRMFIEKHGEAFEAKSMIPELFCMSKSKHWGEKYTTMTAMEGFKPVGENGAYPVDGMQEGYSKFLEHMTWKNSFSISRELVEDAKTMDLRRQPASFITSYYRTREKFAAALFGAAIKKAKTLIPNDHKLKMDVFAAIGADKDPATANNGYNYNFGRWNVIVWPYLNDFITAGTSPWILLDSKYNDENGGAIWSDRTALEVKSRIDEGNDANIWSGYARFIAGFNDWRAFAVGGVTGGTTMISTSTGD